MSKTNITEFIGELGAGTVESKLEHVLSDAALSAVMHGDGKRKSKVAIELTFSQVGENNQVIVSHKIACTSLTKRGKRMEEDTTETPFFVGKGGVLTINPPEEEMTGQFNLQKVDK